MNRFWATSLLCFVGQNAIAAAATSTPLSHHCMDTLRLLTHEDEFFRYRDLSYDIRRAAELIERNEIPFSLKEIPISEYLKNSIAVTKGLTSDSIPGKIRVIKEISDSLTAEDINRPGIAVEMEDGTFLVIDGNHRLNRRHSEGFKTMKVFMIPYSASKDFSSAPR